MAQIIDLTYVCGTLALMRLLVKADPFLASMLAAFVVGGQYWLLTYGKSVGKMVTRLVVVRKGTCYLPGFWSMVGRDCLGKSISGIPVGLGYIWLLVKGSTWHDLIFDTEVVALNEFKKANLWNMVIFNRPQSQDRTDGSASKPRPAPRALIDYYRVLGISPDADGDQIEAAYRQQRQSHRFGHSGSKSLRLINEAYEILGDPLNRKQYDQARRMKGSTK